MNIFGNYLKTITEYFKSEEKTVSIDIKCGCKAETKTKIPYSWFKIKRKLKSLIFPCVGCEKEYEVKADGSFRLFQRKALNEKEIKKDPLSFLSYFKL